MRWVSGRAALCGCRIGNQRRDPLIIRQPPFGEFKTPENDHQQIVEIVGDAAGQLTDGIHLLRVRQRLTRLIERLLRFLTLADVARDLGEADDGAGLVADRIDDDAGPELRAVLAHAPAFLLEPALASRRIERVLRLTFLQVARAIKPREMFAR